jgi:Domain of unknown function (DUF1972)
MNCKKVALLGTHGIPARHGAFEQTIAKLCEIAEDRDLDFHFYVGCSSSHAELELENTKVTRLFANRKPGVGVLIYDMITSLKAYTKGARTFVYFGYEFAPFFLFLRILGVKVICNVDGIEWRRAKWGNIPKIYFRLCEWIVARTANILIFDAYGIERYFGVNHQAKGEVIFYGHDPIPTGDRDPEFDPGSYYSVVMRMEPENNIKSIVEGFSIAKTNKILLIIGPSTKFFEVECMPMIDGKKIRYLGPIYDRDRLNEIRRHSFAYIHGHSVGGTNPTLIEAIGLRNRIIAYNSIFNREVCGLNASYFNSSSDLAKIAEIENMPDTPVLSGSYEWNNVASAYFKLL